MRFLILFLTLTTLSSAHASDEMARRILDVRAQVENQGRDLDDLRRQRVAQLDPVYRRIGELDQGIRKERLKKIQLEEKLKILQSKRLSTLSKADTAQLLEWVESLEKQIQSGVPVDMESRLGKVESLKSRILASREHPLTLVGDLWSATERELKLSATNEYRTQEIKLDGKNVTAELARLGSVQAFFTLANGEAGYGAWESGSWVWKRASESQKESLAKLFESFRQRKLSGLFELPSAWKEN